LKGKLMSEAAKYKTAKDLVREARQQVDNLSAEEVAKEMDRGCVLVDLRDTDERRRDGSIAGAIHVPRGMLEFLADPESPSHRAELGRDKRVVLYCASGGRSALAASTLKGMGYQDVAHLDGGFKAWKKEGKAVQAEE
jgi:rhodanese-related sulfurtransferase